MLDSLMDVTIFRVGLSQLFMGFSRLRFIFSVDTKLQELVQKINGFFKVA
jgi:hypothetical protein